MKMRAFLEQFVLMFLTALATGYLFNRYVPGADVALLPLLFGVLAVTYVTWRLAGKRTFEERLRDRGTEQEH